MPILQPIVNLAELLHRKGIRHVVISPGSRSAPLTLAVARHPHLAARVVADERSAGFIALGLAQQTGQAVAIICTSGSAVYNLSPAVAEAYFQGIPLVLLTADRPHEWLYQQDGQTIAQAGIFGPHVKRSYDLPADYAHDDARWFIERSVNEAVNLATTAPAGPVHINVPLREPFYPGPDDVFQYEAVRVVEQLPTASHLPAETWHRLLDEWAGTDRKLIAVGQLPNDPRLVEVLTKISTELNVPVVGELISNLPRNGQFITQTDTFLAGTNAGQLEALRPDLLITCGGSFLARNLKTFFRQYPAQRHWHLQPAPDRLSDPFRSLTTLIPTEPLAFFEKLFADVDYQHFLQGDEDDDTTDGTDFYHGWQTADRQALRLVNQTVRPATTPPGPFSEWAAVQLVIDALPVDSVLHLANSMPVRYANLCGLEARQRVVVAGNRGTSGIDGCLSTAVGAALATDKPVTLLIGDVAFFYDRNALWNAFVPPNLRIVLLNNHGGHIFRMIDGSSQQPELETYFETVQPLTARLTAEEFGLDYVRCATQAEIVHALPTFFELGTRAKILEITTDKYVNKATFRAYKEQVDRLQW
ncbi:MAG: 2-succinyl-5-enolpyruvyl-6-hydroxy-3-cyclohexene-1-carboxylic-acid synthase [Bacteroidetes bacterium]|nr:2-succinyl-5-enolpyruvyl-6-hydroxy-3-cyclohexene-1-carboxylic-acid synthase [Fibrella sp.]